MKKLLYTLLAVSIIFSACKKEDEVTPTNTNNTGNTTATIIGAWTINTLISESNIGSDTILPEDTGVFSFLNFTTNGILYEIYNNNGEIDTNEWAIIADSLYIYREGDYGAFKHQVTNTNLILRGPYYCFNDYLGSDCILEVHGTRD